MPRIRRSGGRLALTTGRSEQQPPRRGDADTTVGGTGEVATLSTGTEACSATGRRRVENDARGTRGGGSREEEDATRRTRGKRRDERPAHDAATPSARTRQRATHREHGATQPGHAHRERLRRRREDGHDHQATSTTSRRRGPGAQGELEQAGEPSRTARRTGGSSAGRRRTRGGDARTAAAAARGCAGLRAGGGQTHRDGDLAADLAGLETTHRLGHLRRAGSSGRGAGVTLPASISSATRSRSVARSRATMPVSRCPTNQDSTAARSCRSSPPVNGPPSSPPVRTAVPVRGERAAQPGERRVAGDVDDQVVARPASPVLAACSRRRGRRRATRTRSTLAVLATPVTSAPEGLGELDGVAADATRGADHQHVLPGLHPTRRR